MNAQKFKAGLRIFIAKFMKLYLPGMDINIAAYFKWHKTAMYVILLDANLFVNKSSQICQRTTFDTNPSMKHSMFICEYFLISYHIAIQVHGISRFQLQFKEICLDICILSKSFCTNYQFFL
jgi:hypothetical protein